MEDEKFRMVDFSTQSDSSLQRTVKELAQSLNEINKKLARVPLMNREVADVRKQYDVLMNRYKHSTASDGSPRRWGTAAEERLEKQINTLGDRIVSLQNTIRAEQVEIEKLRALNKQKTQVAESFRQASDLMSARQLQSYIRATDAEMKRLFPKKPAQPSKTSFEKVAPPRNLRTDRVIEQSMEQMRKMTEKALESQIHQIEKQMKSGSFQKMAGRQQVRMQDALDDAIVALIEKKIKSGTVTPDLLSRLPQNRAVSIPVKLHEDKVKGIHEYNLTGKNAEALAKAISATPNMVKEVLSASKIASSLTEGFEDLEVEIKRLDESLKTITDSAQRQAIRGQISNLKQQQRNTIKAGERGTAFHKIAELLVKGHIDTDAFKDSEGRDNGKALKRVVDNLIGKKDKNGQEILSLKEYKDIFGAASVGSGSWQRFAQMGTQYGGILKEMGAQGLAEVERSLGAIVNINGRLVKIAGTLDLFFDQLNMLGDIKTGAQPGTFKLPVQLNVLKELKHIAGEAAPSKMIGFHLPFRGKGGGAYPVSSAGSAEVLDWIGRSLNIREGAAGVLSADEKKKIGTLMRGSYINGPDWEKDGQVMRGERILNGVPMSQWQKLYESGKITLENFFEEVDRLGPAIEEFIASMFSTLKYADDGSIRESNEYYRQGKFYDDIRANYPSFYKDLAQGKVSSDISYKEGVDFGGTAIGGGYVSQWAKAYKMATEQQQEAILKTFTKILGDIEDPRILRNILDKTLKEGPIEEFGNAVNDYLVSISDSVLGSHIIDSYEFSEMPGHQNTLNRKESRQEYEPDVFEQEERRIAGRAANEQRPDRTDGYDIDPESAVQTAHRLARTMDIYIRLNRTFTALLNELQSRQIEGADQITGEELAATYLAQRNPELYNQYARGRETYEKYVGQFGENTSANIVDITNFLRQQLKPLNSGEDRSIDTYLHSLFSSSDFGLEDIFYDALRKRMKYWFSGDVDFVATELVGPITNDKGIGRDQRELDSEGNREGSNTVYTADRFVDSKGPARDFSSIESEEGREAAQKEFEELINSLVKSARQALEEWRDHPPQKTEEVEETPQLDFINNAEINNRLKLARNHSFGDLRTNPRKMVEVAEEKIEKLGETVEATTQKIEQFNGGSGGSGGGLYSGSNRVIVDGEGGPFDMKGKKAVAEILGANGELGMTIVKSIAQKQFVDWGKYGDRIGFVNEKRQGASNKKTRQETEEELARLYSQVYHKNDGSLNAQGAKLVAAAMKEIYGEKYTGPQKIEATKVVVEGNSPEINVTGATPTVNIRGDSSQMTVIGDITINGNTSVNSEGGNSSNNGGSGRKGRKTKEGEEPETEEQQNERLREYLALLKQIEQLKLQILKVDTEREVLSRKGESTKAAEDEIAALQRERSLIEARAEEINGLGWSKRQQGRVDQERAINANKSAFGQDRYLASAIPNAQIQAEKELQDNLTKRLSLEKQIEAAKKEIATSVSGREKNAQREIIQMTLQEIAELDNKRKLLEQSGLLRKEETRDILKQYNLQRNSALAKTDANRHGSRNILDVIKYDIQRSFTRVMDYGVSMRLLNSIPRSLSKINQLTQSLEQSLTNLRIVTGMNRKEAEQTMLVYQKMGRQLGATTQQVAESATTWLNPKVWVTLNLSKCWDFLRGLKPQRGDEICPSVRVRKLRHWKISSEAPNRRTFNDYSRASA